MKTAVITGASVGIGEATAKAFLDDGYAVFNLSRRQCPLAGIENITCDLSSEDDTAAGCANLLDSVRNSDSVALVHNASQMLKDSVLECGSEQLRAVPTSIVYGPDGRLRTIHVGTVTQAMLERYIEQHGARGG